MQSNNCNELELENKMIMKLRTILFILLFCAANHFAMANHSNSRSGFDKLLIYQNIMSPQSSILYCDSEYMTFAFFAKIDTIPDIVNFIKTGNSDMKMKNTFWSGSASVDRNDYSPSILSGCKYLVADERKIFSTNFLLI